MNSPESQTFKIISSIIAVQGGILLFWMFSSERFFEFLGFAQISEISLLTWLVSVIVVVGYVWGAASISTVREHMFKLDKLKSIAIVGAVISGIFEELVFRKLLMDYLQGEGIGTLLQILLSGLAFAVAHLVWGAKAISAAINATFYTFFLGVGLAIIYIMSDRNLAACIIAHTLVTGLIEPGLIKSAVLNKLDYLKEKA